MAFKLINSIERHKKFQMVITAGTVGCTILYFLWPEHSEAATLVGCLTNMVWIWE